MERAEELREGLVDDLERLLDKLVDEDCEGVAMPDPALLSHRRSRVRRCRPAPRWSAPLRRTRLPSSAPAPLAAPSPPRTGTSCASALGARASSAASIWSGSDFHAVDTPMWLGGDLAGHVAVHGVWLHGEPCWDLGAVHSSAAARRKEARLVRSLRALEQAWGLLGPAYRAKHATLVRRDVQRVVAAPARGPRSPLRHARRSPGPPSSSKASWRGRCLPCACSPTLHGRSPSGGALGAVTAEPGHELDGGGPALRGPAWSTVREARTYTRRVRHARTRGIASRRESSRGGVRIGVDGTHKGHG